MKRRRHLLGGMLAIFMGWASHTVADFLHITNFNNTITITGTTGTIASINIPSSIHGMPVVDIGAQAFLGLAGATNAFIPDSVHTVHYQAFRGCSVLRSVSLGSGLAHIATEAFQDCNLQVVDIPDSVTLIGARAFDGNLNLESIRIGHGLTNSPRSAVPVRALQTAFLGDQLQTIGGFDDFSNPGSAPLTFYGATSLTHVALGGGITNIGFGAFYDCVSLPHITIPDQVRVIGMDAFRNTIALSNAAFGAGLQRIESGAFESSGIRQVAFSSNISHVGAWAFSGTKSLTSVDFGSGLTAIETGSFAGSGLTNVYIPDNIEVIGSSAFEQATSVVQVAIGAGVTNIGPNAFRRMRSCTGFTVHSNNAAFESHDGYLYTKGQGILIQAPIGLGGTNAFIPSGVTNIGPSSFYSHPTLKTVTIPGHVQTISEWSFPFSSYLERAELGEGVQSIGSYAFAWTKLNEVNLPVSITNIGANAFHRTLFNTNFHVPPNNPSYSSPEGVLYNKDQTTLIQFPLGRGGSYMVRTNTFLIEARAFEGAGSVTSVTLPDSVERIGDSSFFGATSLTHVVLGSGIRHIGNSAFRQCSSLKSITLPAGITNIGSSAFNACTGMQSILFLGDAPAVGSSALGNMPYATVYRTPDGVGWPDPGQLWNGVPTKIGLPPIGKDNSLKMQDGQFGFDANWANSSQFVVQATSSPMNTNWVPVWTNHGTTGLSRFEDATTPVHSQRFYRIQYSPAP